MPYNLISSLIMKVFLLVFFSFFFLVNSHAKKLDAFVVDVIDKKIKTSINELKIQSVKFNQSAINYCDSQSSHTLVSQTMNSQSLKALKEGWVNAYLSWKKVQLFGFGPTGQLRIERHLDFWPTRVAKIKGMLLENDIEKAFKNSGVSVRGFPATEWLIFASENQSIKNHCKLLLLLSKDMSRQIHALADAWQVDLTVVNNSGELQLNSYIYSKKPAEEFINALVVGIYSVRKKSLITPMGLTTGFMDISRMESINSELSTKTFQTRLNSIIDLFEGEQLGLVGWLKSNNKIDLAKKIEYKLDSIKNLKSFINDNFSALIQNKHKLLVELESHMNDLQFIIEEDLSTHFNLIMFFKDLDGD